MWRKINISNTYRKIYVIRHGESIWNHDSKFTGWTDIPLTDKGKNEAKKIANTLINYNIHPNIFFSSVLKRALDTTNIINFNLEKHFYKTHPSNNHIFTSWRLNEKHYGTLEGVRREIIRKEYGKKFTSIMRSNFYMKPPVVKNLPQQNQYPVYKNCYFQTMKNGESKENVLSRLIPYYENDIMYTLNNINNIPLIITHKHCMRVLMKHLLNISDEDFEYYDLPSKNIIQLSYDDNSNFIEHSFIPYS